MPGNLQKDSKVKADEVRNIDRSRLIKSIGRLDAALTAEIGRALVSTWISSEIVWRRLSILPWLCKGCDLEPGHECVQAWFSRDRKK